MFFRQSGTLTSFLLPRIINSNIFRTLNKIWCSTFQLPERVNYFKYNEQETKQILDIINSKPVSELRVYDISKSKLNKIDVWKEKNGKFQDLYGILHLDGFSVKLVEKFCSSILNGAPVKRTPRKATSFVTPNMPDSQIATIQSTIAISVSISAIVWTRLEINKDGIFSLTDWQHYDLKEQRFHLHDLIKHCLYITYLIPQADCYLFENPQVAQGASPGNAEQVNINVQRAQLTAILGFALANRNTSDDKTKSNVFYLKRFLAARLYQNLVGTERVSAEKAVLNLMRTNYNLCDKSDPAVETPDPDMRLGNVIFPDQLRQMYKEAERYHREFLGQTLLLNLSFIRLVLLRDETSIAMLSRSSKTSETE